MDEVVVLCKDEITGLSDASAELLLMKFRWNKDTLMEKFFEDTEKMLQQCGLEPLDDSSDNSEGEGVDLRVVSNGECCVCFSSDVDLFALRCGHGFCRECWEQHLSIAIGDGQAGVSATCPAPKCKVPVPRIVFERLLNGDLLSRYKRFFLASFVEGHPDYRRCINPDCDRVVFVGSSTEDAVCSCRTSFCVECGEEAHRPAACDEVRQWRAKCADESGTYNWMQTHTQDCPKCASAIEKSGGCNHVKCYKCHFEFCWVCLGPWKQHERGSWYKCNRYIPSSESMSTPDPSPSTMLKTKSKTALTRHAHYFHRFVIQDASCKLEKELRRRGELKITELQKNAKGNAGSWMQLEYIPAAIDTLIECRTVLKYTYIKAFFMIDGSLSKSLFEVLQENLESATEELSGLLDADPYVVHERRLEVIDAITRAKQLLERTIQEK